VYLIAGLGNPGPRYRNTRHNAGFMAMKLWAKALNVRLSDRRFRSRYARTTLYEKEIILLCPQTFMNQSGMAIKACADFYGLETGNILIVHDDIDLPVGRVRVVRKGGGGGHKGVLSVIQHLGTRDFARIKIGVGRPPGMEPVEEYVLSPFCAGDEETMEKAVQVSVQACELFVSGGVEEAMNHINGQNMAGGKGEER
jgi:PTH1 family peptidyl-tRNA hydrolase